MSLIHASEGISTYQQSKKKIRRYSSHNGARLGTHPNLVVNLFGLPGSRRLRRYLPTDLQIYNVSLVPKHKALNLLATEERFSSRLCIPCLPVNMYLRHLINEHVQIANKMGLNKITSV
jgi:hypothetical protein